MSWKPDYVTVDEYKEWAGIDDKVDDDRISRDITTASRAVDNFCSQHVPRQFGMTDLAEARVYTPRWDTRLVMWVIEVDDITDTTGLTVEVDPDYDGVFESAITDYILRPRNALLEGLAYTQIAVRSASPVQPTYFPDTARVTVQWGWSVTPVEAKSATLLQTNRFQKRKDAPFGVSGSPAEGNEQQMLSKLDPDIEIMLYRHVKPGWTM